jgi:hypothetical protein
MVLAEQSQPRRGLRPRHTATPTSGEDASSAPPRSSGSSSSPTVPPRTAPRARRRRHRPARNGTVSSSLASHPYHQRHPIGELSTPKSILFPSVLVKFLLARNRSVVALAFHVRLSSPSVSRGRIEQRPGRSHDIQLLPMRSPWLRLPSTTPTSNATARSRGANHDSELGRTSTCDLHDAASAEDCGTMPRSSATSLTSADAAAAQR